MGSEVEFLCKDLIELEHAPSYWMAKGLTPGQGGKHNAFGADLPPTDPNNNLPIKADMYPNIEDTSTEFGITI